ncbi:unnamed protein product [Symbiodinium natans]|uniref:Uncharacterized protein n=1 Tax=Symbiodinium natans TaxID=878477 RepID=A0A812JHI4_9DINO|nr:unnamed protein product [Symbiodinium natans]
MDRQMDYAFPLADDDCDFPKQDAAFRTSYRRRLRLQGREQEYADADVGHIFAWQHAQTNDRNNVFMQDRRWNRVAKDNYDELNCAFSGAQRCRCAYDACQSEGRLSEGRWGGWQPDAIRAQGSAQFREMGLYTRVEGGFDPSSPAIQSGLVQFDAYGRPVGVGSLIQDYERLHGRRRHGRPVDPTYNDQHEAERYAAIASGQQRPQPISNWCCVM